MHALIIESWPLQSMLLESELRKLGFTSFDKASTQDGAVAAASSQRPDLITACVRLSEGCGIAAVKMICARQSIPTIYIVSDPMEAPISASGSVVVAKPMSAGELQQAVSGIIALAGEVGLLNAA